ncbi:nitronate monooxygenase [Alphaproteobacteria bacterium]|nr:nitronate monooxygenase [Alphaproteobacteria bacterium]
MNKSPKASASKHFSNLSSRGNEFLGSDVPIVGGAMSWVSESSLVSSISNAGGFGVIACGSLSPSQLRLEIEKTQKLTKRPFGVNLITMHPELNKLVDICKETNISHVVLAGALPKAETIILLKNCDIKIITFAPSIAVAKRMIRAGSDAIVIEGSEAGGHVGPVSTSVLAQEILPIIKDVPVFVAGGIGRGEAMTMYLEMGASGIQMGTRFVCAKESIAHPNFKKRFLRANSRDATLTIQLDPRFPVIPVRAIENKGTELFNQKQREIVLKFDSGKVNLKDAQLEIEHFWAGALKRAVIDGDIENGSLMAGQGIGLVSKEQTLEEIIEEIVFQAVGSIEKKYLKNV